MIPGFESGVRFDLLGASDPVEIEIGGTGFQFACQWRQPGSVVPRLPVPEARKRVNRKVGTQRDSHGGQVGRHRRRKR